MEYDNGTQCMIIDLCGEPGDRGLMYGKIAADQIGRGIAHYSAQIRASGLSAEDIDFAVAAYLPFIEDFDPDYSLEMRAIAEGAGVSFENIVLLNARTELLKRALAQSAKAAEIEPDGCTGVVALPSATQDGQVLHAQTWDWKAECAETAVLLRIQQIDGPEILTFTEAGGLARSGMNSAGICLSANYLESDRDYQQMGVPLALIRRKILQTPHLSKAYHAAYVTSKSASNNIMISHREGVAMNFECAPDETFLVRPQNGLIVHANHWQSPVALSNLKDAGIKSMPDSLYRDVRVQENLAAIHGNITVENLKDALGDSFGDPWGVCRPPHKSLVNNLSATVSTLIMEPSQGRISVAMLPALGGRYKSYSFRGKGVF